MASSRVGMMCGFLVVSTIVMLGRFAVMVGSVGMMFSGLPMVLCCFFRHHSDPCLAAATHDSNRSHGSVTVTARTSVTLLRRFCEKSHL
jgi:hypothetical protein